MVFDEVLTQVLDLLKREGRVSYRALRIRFNLDDDYIDALKDEIIGAKRLARDENNRILVRIDEPLTEPPPPATDPKPPDSVSSTITVPLTVSDPDALSHPGERRHVTVLFADISGFTALSETMDPESVRDLMNACFSRLVPVVEKYGGTIDKFIGDEIMVLFGAPIAHENDAERAIRTGLEMIEALTAFDSKKGINLGLHCGINTGLVVAGGVGAGTKQNYSVMGDAVNLAARLREAAKKGEVLIGPMTHRLTQALLTCEPTEPLRIKGKADSVCAYRVLGLQEGTQDRNDTRRGIATPLVGRESEVALLLQRWGRVKNGEGQVVLLSGEGGVGKSRLLQSIREHVEKDAPTRLECRCSPYHMNSALYPVVDLLEYVMGFARKDSPDEKLQKLESTLRQYSSCLQETVPLFAALLSFPLSVDRYPQLTLTPQIQRQKSLEAILAMLLELASQKPMLFIVEDLHWIDPSTIELLTSIVKHGPTACIYTLFTSRPGFVSAWMDYPDLTRITLPRLPASDVESLIKGVTGGKPFPSEVVKQIVSKTDGVPLFVEELTKMVLESGQLRDHGDRYEWVGQLNSLAIPDTLQASLMARLDRLGEGKTVAQIGATIGRQFSYELLHAISDLDDSVLQNALGRLVDAQLLFCQGLHPNTTYIFKHALIQDVAYQSLLGRVRNLHHQRIARVLIDQFPEIAESQPERLAQHFSEGGLASEAVDWWLRAGGRALQKSANVEAIKHLDMALGLLANLPDNPENRNRELKVQMSLGPALCATKGYAAPEVERSFGRANVLCRDMSDASQIFPIQWGLWAFYVVRAAFDKAWETAQTMMRIAEAKGDANLLLEAHFAVGLTDYFQGRPVMALLHLREVIALDSPERDRSFTYQSGQDAGVCGLTYAGLALWQMGAVDEALEHSREAVDLARRIQHPFSLAYALNFAGWLHQMCGNVQEAQVLSDEEIDLSTKQGFFWVTLGLVIRGWAEATRGGTAAGLTMIHQGLGGFRGAGARLSQTYQLAIWAETLLRDGRAEEGLRLTDEALLCVEETGERFWESELHRLRCMLFLALSSSQRQEGLASVRKAVVIARKQASPMGMLRAALCLAKMAADVDERDEAHTLLAEILPTFDNKTDFPDLCEARVLFTPQKNGASLSSVPDRELARK
jgi:class 3 adenylate cyclase/predicted ATPase